MQRRTLLKRIGVAGVATAGIGGTATAAPGSGVPLDREVDVSDVSGRVKLDELVEEDVGTLLDDEAVADLRSVDGPADVELVVAEDADRLDFTTSECCPTCGGDDCGCECCFITVC